MKTLDEIAKNHFETFTLGNLTVAETREIVALDYTLTWGFGNISADEKRYIELSKKRWGTK